jgi:putative transposase
VSGIGDGALDHRRRCRREILERLFTERGEPAYIRSDNGPEFIAEAIKRWLAASGVKTLYIEPGAPWENAYSETFISRLRDELLNREVFANLKEAKYWRKITAITTTTIGRMELWGT